jgi:flagellar hook-length control protein FliK
MDTGALMREELSPVHKVQTPSLAPASTETVPVSSTAFAEVGRFPLRHGDLRLSAEQSTAADLPIQAQLPGQQAVGSLRYVPVSRDAVLLQLEPPELGTLLVQVRQVNEQLTASFWAESSDVRSLLQAHFPALNQVLSQQGLAVQQISLHLATGNGFAEQFGQFSQQHGTSQTFSHGSREESSGGRHSALDSPVERYQVGNGRVDIRI